LNETPPLEHDPGGEVRVSLYRRRRPWRQLVSCVIAYAFALQLVLVGLAAPHGAAFAASEDALAAGLCLHDQDAPLAPGDGGGDECCKFCTAAAHTVFTTPPLPCHSIIRTPETAAPPAGDRFISRPLAHITAQPRGPPRTA
jgi:hypothetical protein